VEVQITDPDTKGAGVYFAYDEPASAQGRECWFYEWSFMERERILPTRTATKALARTWINGRRRVERDPETCLLDGRPPGGPRSGHLFPPEQGRWRKLWLEVTPDGVSAVWDGARSPFAVLHPKVMEEGRNDLASQGPVREEGPPALALGGGLGLFCDEGAA